ncbi:MAG TPA: zeta toxin family protein [Streptosporangiaceae bacterium]|nr:zeta toxin family protein [Streptosporangiaceae bacterium]
MAIADAKRGSADPGIDGTERRPDAVASGLKWRLDQLPPGHPSSQRYLDAARPESDRVRPLTDAEHARHVADVKVRLADARGAGLATELQHTVDPDHEIWSSTRRVQHDQLLGDRYAAASGVPCERRAILAGGLPGGGKTTVLREYSGIDVEQYLVINPDAIKEDMARYGLIPVVDGLTPMESADLVHEESSHIAKRLARRAQADGKNVIWDFTLAKADSAAQRMESLRADGYAQVGAVFVDIVIDASVRRAQARYRHGHDLYRAGVGYGGRFVGEEIIRAQANETWGSLNRANFERLKHRFDYWSIYDNSIDGRAPVLTAGSIRARDTTWSPSR